MEIHDFGCYLRLDYREKRAPITDVSTDTQIPMTIQWLLQSNHPNLSSVREIEAILRDQGHDVFMTALKGHSPEIFGVEALDVARPIICYGPSFVPRALRYAELSPGIFFDPATFRWSAFHKGWGNLMVSADGMVKRLAEAVSHIGLETMFVRPDEDSKAFDGGLFDKNSLKAVIDPAMKKAHIDEDTLVVLAEPVRIDAEWRTFIVGGQVVAASSYRKDGVGNIDLHVPHRVIDLAFEAAELWSPAPVFCLDIALTGERYGIVEANCFNASRFYGADASAILDSVSAFVKETYVQSSINEPIGRQPAWIAGALTTGRASPNSLNCADRIEQQEWQAMDSWASVPQGRSADLGNWRTAPHNKWGFHNVNRILTTDLIERRVGTYAPLGSAPRALGDIRFTAPGGSEMTVSECMTQSDTDGFLVLKDNQILHEQYENGMEASSRHVMFSVSKSILGALFGVLKDKGLVDAAALATDYVPELKGSAYDGATVQHVLDMQVAVEFTEDYNAKNGDVDRYRRATGWDPAMPDEGEVATRKMLTEFRTDGSRHGEKFHYVSPNTDAAGWIAERATGLRYAEVLSKFLWQPMGAEFPAYITVDKFGAVRAAGGICACLRDIARFGTLMTRRPLTEGVLPQAFVDDVFDNGDAGAWARGASAAFIPGGRYRNKWYIKPGGRRVALAIGIHGQWIHVDHDRNIVIAKQSSQPLADQPATETMLMACFDAIAEAVG